MSISRITAALLLMAAPAMAEADLALLTEVRSILESKCTGCHGADNQKADLRLDTPEHILKGGKNGPVIVPGKPGESELCLRISREAGAEGIMPPKGDPLTQEQIGTIAKWITEGAKLDQWAEAVPEEPKQMVYASLSVSSPEASAELLAMERLQKLAEGVAAAEPAALEPLQNAGAFVAPIDQQSPLLQVDLKFLPDSTTDDHLAMLPPLAEQITWLDLAGTDITDAGLDHVAGLSRLTSIHLERTGITDAGVAKLAGLANLEYLNLYGTKVTAAGLESLKGLSNLRRLYLWQTEVTMEQAQQLAQALPAATINLGTEKIEAQPVEYNDPAEDLKKMEEAEKAAEEEAPEVDPFAAPAEEAPAEEPVVDPFAA